MCEAAVVTSRRWLLSGGCEAVVIMCDWQQFRELPVRELARVMRGRVLLDAENVLDRRRVEQSGLTYIGMGR